MVTVTYTGKIVIAVKQLDNSENHVRTTIVVGNRVIFQGVTRPVRIVRDDSYVAFIHDGIMYCDKVTINDEHGIVTVSYRDLRV